MVHRLFSHYQPTLKEHRLIFEDNKAPEAPRPPDAAEAKKEALPPAEQTRRLIEDGKQAITNATQALQNAANNVVASTPVVRGAVDNIKKLQSELGDQQGKISANREQQEMTAARLEQETKERTAADQAQSNRADGLRYAVDLHKEQIARNTEGVAANAEAARNAQKTADEATDLAGTALNDATFNRGRITQVDEASRARDAEQNKQIDTNSTEIMRQAGKNMEQDQLLKEQGKTIADIQKQMQEQQASTAERFARLEAQHNALRQEVDQLKQRDPALAAIVLPVEQWQQQSIVSQQEWNRLAIMTPGQVSAEMSVRPVFYRQWSERIPGATVHYQHLRLAVNGRIAVQPGMMQVIDQGVQMMPTAQRLSLIEQQRQFSAVEQAQLFRLGRVPADFSAQLQQNLPEGKGQDALKAFLGFATRGDESGLNALDQSSREQLRSAVQEGLQSLTSDDRALLGRLARVFGSDDDVRALGAAFLDQPKDSSHREKNRSRIADDMLRTLEDFADGTLSRRGARAELRRLRDRFRKLDRGEEKETDTDEKSTDTKKDDGAENNDTKSDKRKDRKEKRDEKEKSEAKPERRERREKREERRERRRLEGEITDLKEEEESAKEELADLQEQLDRKEKELDKPNLSNRRRERIEKAIDDLDDQIDSLQRETRDLSRQRRKLERQLKQLDEKKEEEKEPKKEDDEKGGKTERPEAREEQRFLKEQRNKILAKIFKFTEKEFTVTPDLVRIKKTEDGYNLRISKDALSKTDIGEKFVEDILQINDIVDGNKEISADLLSKNGLNALIGKIENAFDTFPSAAPRENEDFRKHMREQREKK